MYTNKSKGIYCILHLNFELEHVTIVTDLRCFEKPGPDALPFNSKQSEQNSVISR